MKHDFKPQYKEDWIKLGFEFYTCSKCHLVDIRPFKKKKIPKISDFTC